MLLFFSVSVSVSVVIVVVIVMALNKSCISFCFRVTDSEATNPYAGYQLAYEVKKLMYAS